MMDVLITGGTGFVGTNVIKHFSKIGIPFRQLNLRDKLSENALDNAAVVLHLAGKAHDTANTLDPTSYYQINFELTKILASIGESNDGGPRMVISRSGYSSIINPIRVETFSIGQFLRT